MIKATFEMIEKMKAIDELPSVNYNKDLQKESSCIICFDEFSST